MRESVLRRVTIVAAAIMIVALLAGTMDSPVTRGADEGPPGPRIRWEKTTHDFGTLDADTISSFDWVYYNDGDAPLRILETRPLCGCTATVLESDSVAPGAEGILRVTLDPAGMRGSIRKSLAVTTNDAANARMLLAVVANVIPIEQPVEEGGHPRITGQSLLVGDCATCHAAPAKGKTGAELYGAVCGMCHGAKGEGNSAPALRTAGDDERSTAEDLKVAISYGTANPEMPGFVDLMGGPLDKEQVDSLVELIRGWDPAP